MTKPLDGKLALVTGASKGIGAATAIALAEAGAHVVLTGRDVRALEQVEDQIHAVGGASTIAPVDLAESDGIARLATAISDWCANTPAAMPPNFILMTFPKNMKKKN